MFDLDNINETRKVRADIAQLKRRLEFYRKQEDEARDRREDMEASIAKREAFLAIMEMSWHYQNLPDGHVQGFKRYGSSAEFPDDPDDTAEAAAKAEAEGDAEVIRRADEMRKAGLLTTSFRMFRPAAEVVPIESAKAGKPAGLPTMAEMVRECITEAGYPCLPRDVTAYIRAKWWGDVNPAVVKTTLWKMAKEGRLVHTGSHYGLHGANGHDAGHTS